MKRVLVGLSGGVDSAVSAFLLRDNYEVIGCNINFINPSFTPSEDAYQVAKSLNIEFKALDMYNDFKDKVIGNFVESYKTGLTPNPCVECNRFFKFGQMYEYAKSIGCDYIATGHYARVEYSNEYRRYVIKRSLNEKKDQSYFLYAIHQDVIEHIIFPLDNIIDKSDVRTIAHDNNIPVANKKDSLDVCFIDTDYKDYLVRNNYVKEHPGNIVFKDGTILGKHSGMFKYTIGQRKGLMISYKEPLYVIGFNKYKNEVIVGLESDLYKSEVELFDTNLLLFDEFIDGMVVYSKIRYQAPLVKSYLYHHNDTIKVVFDAPQKSPTSGQSLVFYVGDILAGGGKIK